MTGGTELPTLLVRSPEALLHTLDRIGAAPRDGAVLVLVSSTSPRRAGRVAAVATVESGFAWLNSSRVVTETLKAASGRPDGGVVVGYGDCAVYAALLAQEAVDAGLDLLDVLEVRGGRWRSTVCTSPDCCPVEGRELLRDPFLDDALDQALEGQAQVGRDDPLGGPPLAGRDAPPDPLIAGFPPPSSSDEGAAR